MERVSVEEIQAAMDQREVVLIDARRHLDFRLEHLPGAINVPWDQVNFTGSTWEDWKQRSEVVLVVYCRSAKCEDADK